MKYRLNELVKAAQNVTLIKNSGNPRAPRKAVFLRLEPGYFYDKYADDPMFVESLRNWKITVRYSKEIEAALNERGIPFEKRKGCACTGGVKIMFPGIEVVEE